MKLLYLIGAGRSGTTILSLMLSNSESITSLGELHQLPEHMGLESSCSCGEELKDCPLWSSAYDKLNSEFCSKKYKEQAKELESHRYVYKYLFTRERALNYSEYCSANEAVFDCLRDTDKYKVDSAKYIGRGLALNSILQDNIRFIYMVRDPRGVVNSFGKNVQTSRNWLSATAYYFIVNLTASFVCKILLRNKYIKLKYEDLITKPDNTLMELAEKLDVSLDEVRQKLINDEGLSTGHMVGGNRLVKNKVVHFKSNESWWEKMPRWKQWLIWLLTMPLNIINGYKP
ncbi:sulfotransferase [Kangiella sediminilitoris]|uniref:Sulfotransferase n=1 Tax=Kangiella sediminilitoris TaxID=1144748 RepID=A0A1B3BBJ3_9GAMM|nr:sulfotransferase [Kangiella sediminilitoris]AOE50160.1 hypothetical protein KS2013_1448 [Kangiella sediminilitoris]